MGIKTEVSWARSNIFRFKVEMKDAAEFRYPTAQAAMQYWDEHEVRKQEDKAWEDMTPKEQEYVKLVYKGQQNFEKLTDETSMATSGATFDGKSDVSIRYRPPIQPSFTKTFTTHKMALQGKAFSGSKTGSSKTTHGSKIKEDSAKFCDVDAQNHPEEFTFYKKRAIWATQTGRFFLGFGDSRTCLGKIFDPLCEGNESEFELYGPGTAAWFKFLKWAGWTLLIMFCIQIPSMIFNMYNYEICAIKAGKEYAPLDLYTEEELDTLYCYSFSLFATMLGHISTVSEVTIDGHRFVGVLNIEKYIDDTLSYQGGSNAFESLAWHYIVLDVLTVVVLLVSFGWMQVSLYQFWGSGLMQEKKSKAAIKGGSQNVFSASDDMGLKVTDYTIQLHGVPFDVMEEDIVKFVAEVLGHKKGQPSAVAVNPFCPTVAHPITKKMVPNYEIHDAVHHGSKRLTFFATRGKVMNEFVIAHLVLNKLKWQYQRNLPGNTVTAWHCNLAHRNRNRLLFRLRHMDTKEQDKTMEDGEDDTLFTVITFNTIQDKNTFVRRLRKPWCWCCYPQPPMFHDDHDIRSVKQRFFKVYTSQPRHPSQIIWENLHYGWFTTCSRDKRDKHGQLLTFKRGGCMQDLFFRRVSIFILAVGVILCTFALSVYLNAVATENAQCPEWSSDLVLASTSICGACGAKGEDLYSNNSLALDYQQCNSTMVTQPAYIKGDVNPEDALSGCFWAHAEPAVADAAEACEAQFLANCFCLGNFWTSCCLSFYGSYDQVAVLILEHFGISFGISFIIIGASMLMRMTLGYVVAVEHAHSLASNEVHASTRILFFQLLNSGLLLLFLPIEGEIAFNSFGDMINLEVNEVWKERIFTVQWYDIIGPLVISTNLCYAVSSWLPYLMYPFLLKWKRHGLLAPRACVSSIELNARGNAEPFMLRDRIADMMTVFFLTVMFSSGYPILLLIASGAFFSMYWVDKYLFLRYYSINTEYSLEIMKSMTKQIAIAVILHCITAVFMFGNYQIFMDMGSPADGGSKCKTDEDGREWCEYSHEYNVDDAAILTMAPLVLMGVGVMIIYFLFKASNIVCSTCLKKSAKKRKEKDRTTYKDFAENALITEIVTYNILANPKYQSMLGLEGDGRNAWRVQGLKQLYQLKDRVFGLGQDMCKDGSKMFKYEDDYRRPGCGLCFSCCPGRKLTDEEIPRSRCYFLVPPWLWPW